MLGLNFVSRRSSVLLWRWNQITSCANRMTSSINRLVQLSLHPIRSCISWVSHDNWGLLTWQRFVTRWTLRPLSLWNLGIIGNALGIRVALCLLPTIFWATSLENLMINCGCSAHDRAASIFLTEGMRCLILVPWYLSLNPAMLIASVASHIVCDWVD